MNFLLRTKMNPRKEKLKFTRVLGEDRYNLDALLETGLFGFQGVDARGSVDDVLMRR